MTASKKDLEQCVDNVFGTKWNVRDGRVVPTTDDVALKDGAVKINAAFLYADLAQTAKLAEVCPWETTAKIIRAYLECSVRLIKAYGGEIRSFDGDRVMGVFMGDSKNSNATFCGREIFYTVEKIIGPKATENFKSIRENGIKIKNCVGIDSGDVRAVRAGIRNNNDLIWIGRAASLSAKLSDVREYPYCVYISDTVYKNSREDAKIVNSSDIWESGNFEFGGKKRIVYRTKTLKTP